jgi:hypothetical protein
VTDIAFADDLVLMTITAEEAQDLLPIVELATNSIRSHLNERKTKCTGINLSDDSATTSGKESDIGKSSRLCLSGKSDRGT